MTGSVLDVVDVAVFLGKVLLVWFAAGAILGPIVGHYLRRRLPEPPAPPRRGQPEVRVFIGHHELRSTSTVGHRR